VSVAARIPRLREGAAWKALEVHHAASPELGSPEAASLSHDSSINSLIRRYRRLAGR